MTIKKLYTFDKLALFETDVNALINLDTVFHNNVVKAIGHEYEVGPDDEEALDMLVNLANGVLFYKDGAIAGRI